jgi:hypothetical protein
MELLGDVGQVDVHLVRLGMMSNLAQDRSTVCTECITGMEIFLAAPNGPLR